MDIPIVGYRAECLLAMLDIQFGNVPIQSVLLLEVLK
jgi:hypothetical protein